ncbi:MAG: Mth938-like domain-containing protein [Bacillota bacterium]
MKIERDAPDGRNTFTAYGEGYVDVNRVRYTGSVVVNGDTVSGWAATSVETLSPEQVEAVAALRPEIALIGTGKRFAFPEPAALAPLYRAGIGVEVMDTHAACRTYNILLGEGRNVAAALILGEGTQLAQ